MHFVTGKTFLVLVKQGFHSQKCQAKLFNKYNKPFILFANDFTSGKSSSYYLPLKSDKTSRLNYGFMWIGFLLGGYILISKYDRIKKLCNVNAALPLLSEEIVTDDKPPVSQRSKFNFIADIVEKNAPALVCIEIKDRHRLDFAHVHPSRISGSGFIFDENGLILTNAHVIMVHPNSVILVKLSDGATYPAQVEDVDVKSDLAMLRIRPNRKLPTMKLGLSKDIKPGEWVIAMGSPLSLSNTITAGVVSSVSRTSSELGLYGRDMDYIQTDAAITFGNSGGPLVNLDGEVVGINSMKISTGISFAIPIDYAKEFIQRSKNKKGAKVDRRYLGVTMLTLTTDLIHELQARNNTLPAEVTAGVLVWKVVIGSPAHRAGLIPGDVIVKMNDKQLKNVNEIYKALETYSVLKFGVYRSDMFLEFTVYPEQV